MNVNVHKIINGDGAEKYLPMALAKVRWLMETFPHNMAQVFQVEDTTIRVSTDVASGQCFVRIDGGGLSAYEFLIKHPSSPRNTVGKTVRVEFSEKGEIKYRQLGTNIAGFPPVSGKPLLASSTELGETFYRGLLQAQGHQFHSYVHRDYEVYTVWRQSYPYYNFFTGLGSAGEQMAEQDVRYDTTPVIYPHRGGGSQQSHALAPDTDWYRSGTLHVATYQGTERTFVLEIDHQNVLHVFPLGQARDDTLWQDSPYAGQYIKTNAHISKSVTLPLPAWCANSIGPARDNSTDLVDAGAHPDYPSYQWEFNSTGTKAAAVVIERKDPGAYYYNALKVAALLGGDSGQVKYGQPMFVPSAQGLVEIEISVIVSGPDAEDYTLSASVVHAVRPFTDNRWVSRCGYISKATATKQGITPDTLLTLELELFANVDAYNAGNAEHPPPSPCARYVVRNAAKTSEFFSIPLVGHEEPGEMDPYATAGARSFARLVSCDLPNLAFIVESRAWVTTVLPEVKYNTYNEQDVHSDLSQIDGGLHVRTIVHGEHQAEFDISKGITAARTLLDAVVSPGRPLVDMRVSSASHSGNYDDTHMLDAWWWWRMYYRAAYMPCCSPANPNPTYHVAQTDFLNLEGGDGSVKTGTTFLCDVYRAMQANTLCCDDSQKFTIKGDKFWAVCAGPFLWCASGALSKSRIGFNGYWENDPVTSWRWVQSDTSIPYVTDFLIDEMGLSLESFESHFVDVIRFTTDSGVVTTSSHLTVHNKTGGSDTYDTFCPVDFSVVLQEFPDLRTTHYMNSYYALKLGIGSGYVYTTLTTKLLTGEPSYTTTPDSPSQPVWHSSSIDGVGYWEGGYSTAVPFMISAFDPEQWAYMKGALVGVNTHGDSAVLIDYLPRLKSAAMTIGKFERKK